MVLGLTKGTSLRETAPFGVLCIKIGVAVFEVDVLKAPSEKNSQVNFGPEGCEITHVRKRSRFSDLDNHCANFGDDRLRSLEVMGQILLFCLYIRRRLYEHFTTIVMSVD